MPCSFEFFPKIQISFKVKLTLELEIFDLIYHYDRFTRKFHNIGSKKYMDYNMRASDTTVDIKYPLPKEYIHFHQNQIKVVLPNRMMTESQW